VNAQVSLDCSAHLRSARQLARLSLSPRVIEFQSQHEDISEAYYVLRHVMFNCKSGVEVRS
jgi:hypothetical protein